MPNQVKILEDFNQVHKVLHKDHKVRTRRRLNLPQPSKSADQNHSKRNNHLFITKVWVQNFRKLNKKEHMMEHIKEGNNLKVKVEKNKFKKNNKLFILETMYKMRKILLKAINTIL